MHCKAHVKKCLKIYFFILKVQYEKIAKVFIFYFSTRFNRTLRKQLGQCLNPPNSKSNDWRMLAQRLNVDRSVFHCIRILAFNNSSINSRPSKIFKSNLRSVVKSSKFVPNKCHTLMSLTF